MTDVGDTLGRAASKPGKAKAAMKESVVVTPRDHFQHCAKNLNVGVLGGPLDYKRTAATTSSPKTSPQRLKALLELMITLARS